MFRTMKNNTLRTGVALFVLAVLLMFLGAIFKIQHWPKANALLVSGMVLQAPATIFLVLGLNARSRSVQP